MTRLVLTVAAALGLAMPVLADNIDDCQAAIRAGDRTAAMMFAQAISVLPPRGDEERMRLALECLNTTLDDTFLVVDGEFVSGRSVSRQRAELAEARSELNELRASLDGASSSLGSGYSLASIDILACVAEDLVAVLPIRKDAAGNRVEMLNGVQYDAAVIDGDRITLVAKETVIIIDGNRISIRNGETEFSGRCNLINRQVQNVLTNIGAMETNSISD